MILADRIKAFLATLQFPGMEASLFPLMIHSLMHLEVQRPLKAFDRLPEIPEERRWAQSAFTTSAMIRTLPNFKWPDAATRVLEKKITSWRGQAKRWAASTLSPSHALWCHWILLAGEHHLNIPADPYLLDHLWITAFRHQSPAGHLHPLTPDTLLDAFVYDELTALHAAYNSARLLKDPAKVDQVRRIVRWHVDNTQPDNTTNEPWAHAAFAALDETATFAEQQFHDAVTHLRNASPLPNSPPPIAVGLLADALITLNASTPSA